MKKWFTTVLDVVKILFPSSNFLFCNVLILCLTFCWRENQNRRYSLNLSILFPSSNFLFCNVLILCLTFCWRENQNRRYSLNLSGIPAYPSLVCRCTSVYCEWQRLMSRSKEVKQEIIKVPFLDSKVTLHSKSPESDST